MRLGNGLNIQDNRQNEGFCFLAGVEESVFSKSGFAGRLTPLHFSQSPGYSAEMKKESLDAYEYPNGSEWKKLVKNGLFEDKIEMSG